MSDTQWPRFQVFHQERLDRPHLDAGSVHAPDPELALQYARDVFVRRPACVSLWVVPTDQITAVTAEALSRDHWPSPQAEAQAQTEPYLVFLKRSPRGTYEHAGEVQAASRLDALQQAVRRTQASAYWVIPERSVLASPAQESQSFFEPAGDKTYRDQAAYPTDSLLRDVRREGEQNTDRP